MKRMGLVKAITLEPFIRFLTDNGINLDPHIRSAHLPPELVAKEDSWLPKQQVYHFLADVASTHNLEALGLIVGDQICVADLGQLGTEIYQSDTLNDACLRFGELVPQFAEGNASTLETSGPKTWFAYQTTDHRQGNRDYADHYGMMMLLSIVRLVAGHWYPNEVTIQTGPCEAFGQHPAWNDTKVSFNAPGTGFAFHSNWLDRPIPSPPEHLPAYTPGDPYPSNPPETLTRSLEIILTAYLNIGGVPSLDQIAGSLNLSERTLKRRLAAENDTYSGIVDRVRIQLAEKLLRDSVTSVKETAYILGYSGGNNFIRAFRRISGTTPDQFRKGSGSE